MLIHKGTQTLHTARLTLRRFTAEDAPAMFKHWASDSEVTRYLTWPTHPSEEVSRAIIESWVADYGKNEFYQWAIEFDGEVIGSIAVVDRSDDLEKAEIGYCIGKPWWHRGIMTEALGAVIGYLFSEVGLQRIESRHDPRNPHSGGVMKNCGMKYEGTHRRADRNNQGICDCSCYAILKEEYRKE